MFGRVSFSNIGMGEAIVIPRSAVVGSLRNAFVYVIENGVAKKRNIVTGDDIGTSVAVVSGLTRGETVVTAGQNTLEENAVAEIIK